jgi:hypothetical protein
MIGFSQKIDMLGSLYSIEKQNEDDFSIGYRKPKWRIGHLCEDVYDNKIRLEEINYYEKLYRMEEGI